MNMGREERVIVVEPLESPSGAEIDKDVDRQAEAITTSWIPTPSDPAWATATVPGDGPS